MLKHIYSVLCERIIIDQRTNLASYLNCVEGLSAKKLPAALQNLAFGSRWYKHGKSDEILKFKLSVISPTGDEKQLIESKEQVVQSDNHRTNIILDGLSFEQDGTYIFRLKKQEGEKWNVVHEIPLKVEITSLVEENKPVVKNNKSIIVPRTTN
jgi:hypothetical protein